MRATSSGQLHSSVALSAEVGCKGRFEAEVVLRRSDREPFEPVPGCPGWRFYPGEHTRCSSVSRPGGRVAGKAALADQLAKHGSATPKRRSGLPHSAVCACGRRSALRRVFKASRSRKMRPTQLCQRWRSVICALSQMLAGCNLHPCEMGRIWRGPAQFSSSILNSNSGMFWMGVPTFDQLKDTLRLRGIVLKFSRHDIRTPKQLALFADRLRKSRSTREFLNGLLNGMDWRRSPFQLPARSRIYISTNAPLNE